MAGSAREPRACALFDSSKETGETTKRAGTASGYEGRSDEVRRERQAGSEETNSNRSSKDVGYLDAKHPDLTGGLPPASVCHPGNGASSMRLWRLFVFLLAG